MDDDDEEVGISSEENISFSEYESQSIKTNSLSPPENHAFRPHVRRGSEGYEVKMLTPADRERQLREAMGTDRQKQSPSISKDKVK